MREFASKMPLGLVLFVLGLSISVNGQNDCSDAPNANARRTCMNMRRMDQNARSSAAATTNEVQEIWPPSLPGSPVWQQPIPVPPNSRGQIATHPYDCMTLQCLCPWFRGQMAPDGNCMLQSGQPLVMAYRKEYRMMTEDERWRWHRALTVLKQNGEYDRLSSEHLAVGQGSGAHSGPGFPSLAPRVLETN
ncbi:ShKT domain-containing protein [Aphelenchoides bicaudatus]|nr:ShKT domain-containing protein [Aphelenchoides bicaudatus]